MEKAGVSLTRECELWQSEYRYAQSVITVSLTRECELWQSRLGGLSGFAIVSLTRECELWQSWQVADMEKAGSR